MAKAQRIDSRNVAIGCPAFQSSLSPGGSAQDAAAALAPEGSRAFAFETDGKDFPFWQVDLGQMHRLDRIVVHNRTDDFQYRARKLIVEVSLNRRDWTLIHQGLLYWDGALELPLGGAVQARYVRLRLDERFRLHLARVEVFARHYLDHGEPVFVANRDDGLGERLNALLNAIWLAEMHGCGFRFCWSDRFSTDPTHAIRPAAETFAPGFLDRHLISDAQARGLWTITGPGRSLPDIGARLARLGQIAAPREDLASLMAPEEELSDTTALSRAFARIEFSDEISDAIRTARALPLPADAVAIHLRAGDIIFGPYRKYIHFAYKALPVTLVRMVLDKMQAEGRAVYLFGQDATLIDQLSDGVHVHDGTGLAPDAAAAWGRPARALFDLVLLSRFPQILGGTSGFIRQACAIGGCVHVEAPKLFTAPDQYRFAMQHLAEAGAAYAPLQTAFAYWHSFYYGRKKRAPNLNVAAIEQAVAHDPENETYRIALAAQMTRAGRASDADEVLKDLFETWAARGATEAIHDIFGRKTVGAFNLSEFFPDLEALAETSPHAALLFLGLGLRSGDTAMVERYRVAADGLLGDFAPEARVVAT